MHAYNAAAGKNAVWAFIVGVYCKTIKPIYIGRPSDSCSDIDTHICLWYYYLDQSYRLNRMSTRTNNSHSHKIWNRGNEYWNPTEEDKVNEQTKQSPKSAPTRSTFYLYYEIALNRFQDKTKICIHKHGMACDGRWKRWRWWRRRKTVKKQKHWTACDSCLFVCIYAIRCVAMWWSI